MDTKTDVADVAAAAYDFWRFFGTKKGESDGIDKSKTVCFVVDIFSTKTQKSGDDRYQNVTQSREKKNIQASQEVPSLSLKFKSHPSIVAMATQMTKHTFAYKPTNRSIDRQ